MGGLITNCNPQDLPEGASPRNWDVDYITGSVFTRAGLQSVYVYTKTLQITQVTVSSGVSLSTFTYVGTDPTVNEEFVLSGFIGAAYPLNGQTITVLSVNSVSKTFTALTTGLSTSTYANLAGTATSTTGEFAGPNTPTVAVASGTGNAWSNPTAIIGTAGYASVLSGTQSNVVQVPTQADVIPAGGQAWSNPANITSLSQSTTITLTSGQAQDPLVAYQGSVSIPSNATVVGIKASIKAYCSVSGIGSLKLQLTNGNTLVPYGTPVSIPLGTTSATYTAGSSAYQWGTSLTPVNVNGNEIGIQVSAVVTANPLNPTGTSATFTANSLSLTVYYVLAGSTQVLNTTGYTFSVPSTSGISGFVSSFQAYSTGTSEIILQLLRNGIAVGQPKVQALTSTPTVYSLGESNDLWGSTWLYSDVNNPQFGVQITVTGTGTTFVNDIDVLTYITPALTNFNYIKSYVQNTGQTYTLALDANGIMWQEDVTNLPGTLAVSLTGILPGSFARSATMNNKEHIVFSDLSIGTERPRIFDGEVYHPLSQCGPGASPSFTTTASSVATPLTVTAYTTSMGVTTFTINVVGTAPVVGALYKIAGTGNAQLDGFTFSVLGTPAPTTTSFAVASSATGSASGLTATASPTNYYQISSINQPWTQYPPLQPTGDPTYYPGDTQAF